MKMYYCVIGSYVPMLLKYTTESLCICLKLGILTRVPEGTLQGVWEEDRLSFKSLGLVKYFFCFEKS